MKTWQVSARALRAAKYFQAGKKEIRYFLQGVNLCRSEGLIQATNGHYAVEIEQDLKKAPRDMLIDVVGNIPAKAEVAAFAEVDVSKGIIEYRNSHDVLIGMGCYVVVDGKFPPFEKVRDKYRPAKIDRIGVNPEYMATVGKAFRALYPGEYPAVEFLLSGRESVMKVVPKIVPDSPKMIVWLMPVTERHFEEGAQ